MKLSIRCFTFWVALFVLGGASTFAGSTPSGGSKHGACGVLFKACKANGKIGRELLGCVKTIKDGGSVEGVTVAKSDLLKCQKAMPTKSETKSKSE